MINETDYYIQKQLDRWRQRGSSGRWRVVDGVDVIGVRSASEVAENQSFLRTTGGACFRTE